MINLETTLKKKDIDGKTGGTTPTFTYTNKVSELN